MVELEIRRASIVERLFGQWGCLVTDVSVQQLFELIHGTQSSYYKLTLLAGGATAGKTRMLKLVADQLDLPLISLNLLLSQRLLSHNNRQRSLHAEGVALDIIDEHASTGLCIDNTELLFDSTLRLNPLVFLQEISRNRLVVATWNGVFANGELRYAHNGHPDAFSQLVTGHPVLSVAEDKLHLHLTS